MLLRQRWVRSVQGIQAHGPEGLVAEAGAGSLCSALLAALPQVRAHPAPGARSAWGPEIPELPPRWASVLLSLFHGTINSKAHKFQTLVFFKHIQLLFM